MNNQHNPGLVLAQLVIWINDCIIYEEYCIKHGLNTACYIRRDAYKEILNKVSELTWMDVEGELK